jgi:hypothetical protein
MSLFRHILVLIALLAHAWPVLSAPDDTAAKTCAMGCCSGLAGEEMAVCGCVTPSTPAEPAQPTLPSSREVFPQPVWVDAASTLTQPKRRVETKATRFSHHEAEGARVPQVRLAVLFCSFLN